MTARYLVRGVLAIAVLGYSGAALAGDGIVALQTADASCPDDSGNRFVDCGNGTVTDNQTGLVWLANADCFGLMDWYQAMAAVSGLGDLQCSPEPGDCDCGLSDGSSPGEWRLPSRDEWVVMIAVADGLGCDPRITNDAEDDCWDEQCFDVGACSFHNVQLSAYWSSSSYVPSDPWSAWIVGLFGGNVTWGGKIDPERSWPVRGGQ